MIVLFEFEKKPLFFESPIKIIDCHQPDKIHECFEEMEEAIKQGFYLAGFISYEAGYAFEENLAEKNNYDFPLLRFGAYPSPSSLPSCLLSKVEKISATGSSDLPFIKKGIKGVRTNISFPAYSQNINAIKSLIASGDTYQITYCLKYLFDFEGDPYSLYRRLLKEQPVPYPAYIKTGDIAILSLSPEMFIKKQNRKITTKPMKGTWMRGKTLLEDLLVKRRLHLDPKNRAENVMIADLLRNDLGKISMAGTVVTPRLFEVARYATLCQMTSTVCGQIDPNIKIFDLFKALFPSGSVTGAPKIRSMEIIKRLEKEERKIYTGAIGYITPQKDMFFNVPIRTIVLTAPERSNPAVSYAGEMGVGGGIVWDSTPEGEWDECMVKSEFLLKRKN